MAPLPSNNTAVVFVDYEVAGYNHTMQVRFDAPNTPSDVLPEIGTILTALDVNLYASNLIGVRYRVAGGTVTLPFASTGLPSSWGGPTATGDESARFYDFVGRSGGGKRVRFSIFGAVVLTYQDKYRIPTNIGTPWTTVQDVLDSAEGTFLAIDGLPATWYQYVNTGVNAYWRNQIR